MSWGVIFENTGFSNFLFCNKIIQNSVNCWKINLSNSSTIKFRIKFAINLSTFNCYFYLHQNISRESWNGEGNYYSWFKKSIIILFLFKSPLLDFFWFFVHLSQSRFQSFLAFWDERRRGERSFLGPIVHIKKARKLWERDYFYLNQQLNCFSNWQPHLQDFLRGREKKKIFFFSFPLKKPWGRGWVTENLIAEEFNCWS